MRMLRQTDTRASLQKGFSGTRHPIGDGPAEMLWAQADKDQLSCANEVPGWW